MKYLSFIILFGNSIFSQNYVAGNCEVINYGSININSVSAPYNWSTSKNVVGKFSNYGGGNFTNNGEKLSLKSTGTRWINGYVKHYATIGNLTHLYPVGNNSEPLFVSTTAEIAQNSITIGWIDGPYKVTNKVAGIRSVSSVGRWDYSASAKGSIIVRVKLPDSFVDDTNLRLVGWDGTEWVSLSGSSPYDGGSTNGVLSGVINVAVSAIGIGSISDIIKVKDAIKPSTTNLQTIHHLNIYPNPSTGIFFLDYNFNFDGVANLNIIDVNGKVLIKRLLNLTLESNRTEVDLSGISTGIYFVIIADNTNNPLCQPRKIILK